MEKEHCTTWEQIDLLKAQLETEASPKEIKRIKVNKTLSVFVNVLFAVVIVVLLLALFGVQLSKEKGETPEVFGFSLLRVETGSMEPTLPVGSIILAKKPSDTAALAVGDVVTFLNLDGVRITHRIVEVTSSDGAVAYRTKGDNPKNSVDDEILTQDRVIAVFVRKVK